MEVGNTSHPAGQRCRGEPRHEHDNSHQDWYHDDSRRCYSTRIYVGFRFLNVLQNQQASTSIMSKIQMPCKTNVSNCKTWRIHLNRVWCLCSTQKARIRWKINKSSILYLCRTAKENCGLNFLFIQISCQHLEENCSHKITIWTDASRFCMNSSECCLLNDKKFIYIFKNWIFSPGSAAWRTAWGFCSSTWSPREVKSLQSLSCGCHHNIWMNHHLRNCHQKKIK